MSKKKETKPTTSAPAADATDSPEQLLNEPEKTAIIPPAATTPIVPDPDKRPAPAPGDFYAAHIAAHWPDVKPKDEPTWAELKKKLLALGGNKLLRLHDRFLAQVVERGARFAPEKVAVTRSSLERIYQKVAAKYLSDPETFALASGYALDGEVWGPHWWLWRQDKKLIVETTSLQDIYFGILLNEVETADFVMTAVIGLLPGWHDLMRQFDSEKPPAQSG